MKMEIVMGLDAAVRCRCFEEGKLNPGPLAASDLYINDEGHLASHTLDDAREKYDREQFDDRYGDLSVAFYAWLRHPCEHERGIYRSEWVASLEGVRKFNTLLESMGGEDDYPLLSKMLPSENDGSTFPFENASSALKEIDRFSEEYLLREGRNSQIAERIRSLLVASNETGNPIEWL